MKYFGNGCNEPQLIKGDTMEHKLCFKWNVTERKKTLHILNVLFLNFSKIFNHNSQRLKLLKLHKVHAIWIGTLVLEFWFVKIVLTKVLKGKFLVLVCYIEQRVFVNSMYVWVCITLHVILDRK